MNFKWQFNDFQCVGNTEKGNVNGHVQAGFWNVWVFLRYCSHRSPSVERTLVIPAEVNLINSTFQTVKARLVQKINK